jgi:hypothetical protein
MIIPIHGQSSAATQPRRRVDLTAFRQFGRAWAIRSTAAWDLRERWSGYGNGLQLDFVG